MADNDVPVIDFSAYRLDREEPDHERFQDLIDDIHGALTTVGCMYLKDSGIPAGKIDECFRTSKAFFQLPVEVKRSNHWSEDNYNGYRGMEEEGLNIKCEHKDPKELFNYMPHDKNQQLPDEKLPEFRTALEELFADCRTVHNRLLEVFARGLKLQDPQYFAKHHVMMGQTGNKTTLRTLYYPPLSDLTVKAGQIRCGEHTDWGSISFIFQDAPGLEIMRDGRWIPVPPIDGSIVVFLAETMQTWTVDKYMAAKHRVMLPTHCDQSRQSIVLFGIRDIAAPIEPIERSEKYPPFDRFDDYLAKRITDYSG